MIQRFSTSVWIINVVLMSTGGIMLSTGIDELAIVFLNLTGRM